MRRFGELPIAIESRGFVPMARGTFYLEVRASRVDYLVALILLTLVLVAVYLRLMGYGTVFPDVI